MTEQTPTFSVIHFAKSCAFATIDKVVTNLHVAFTDHYPTVDQRKLTTEIRKQLQKIFRTKAYQHAPTTFEEFNRQFPAGEDDIPKDYKEAVYQMILPEIGTAILSLRKSCANYGISVTDPEVFSALEQAFSPYITGEQPISAIVPEEVPFSEKQALPSWKQQINRITVRF